MVEQAALIVSIAAVVVSVWAGTSAARTSKKQVRLEEQQNHMQADLLRIEKSRERDRLASALRADLRALLRRGSDRMAAELRITNGGAASADNIRITIDGTSITDHDLFKFRDVKPVTAMAPGGFVAFRMLAYDGMEQRYHVAIEWDDETGPGRRWASDLSLESGG